LSEKLRFDMIPICHVELKEALYSSIGYMIAAS
jgi:hypothetical protein